MTESKIKIARIGQLTGDTKEGVWNMREAYPLILSTMRQLGCLPKLRDPLNWLPLDEAAKIIIDIAFWERENNPDDFSESEEAIFDSMGNRSYREKKAKPESVEVHHVLNKHKDHTFTDFLDWLQEMMKEDEKFEVVEPNVWMDRLEALEGNHPAKALLGFWRKAYGDVKKNGEGKNGVQFETAKAEKKSMIMRDVKPMDKELVKRIWTWLDDQELH